MKLLAAMLIASLMSAQTPQLYAGPQRDVWVAFRYDRDRVIFYTERLVDPESPKVINTLPSPVARYGGVHLISLTPEQLATFQPSPEFQGGGERVQLNQKYTLWLDGKNTIEATTESYAEEWGTENPIVRIAILARVSRTFKGNYFLISRERNPTPPPATTLPLHRSRTILASFGALGKLAAYQFELGWTVSLLTPSGKRTNVEYSYGD